MFFCNAFEMLAKSLPVQHAEWKDIRNIWVVQFLYDHKEQ